MKPSSTAALGIVYRSIDELKPNPANSRIHTERQLKLLAKSIDAVGFNVPVLIDSKDTVLAGHARIEGAKRLGLREVPTIRLDHLTEAQAKAFLIADNRLAEIAIWVERLLAEQLQELSRIEIDFSL